MVYVTGTFDNWSKSVKLDKKDQVHEKLVNLPKTEDKIYYKVSERNEKLCVTRIPLRAHGGHAHCLELS